MFQWEDRTPLSKTKFIQTTLEALTAAGLLAKDYACYSFKIGAAAAGLEDSAIQTLGRWKSSALHSDQSSTASSSAASFVKMPYTVVRSPPPQT